MSTPPSKRSLTVTHAYCAGMLADFPTELQKARDRLGGAWPVRTLIHIHPAGPNACQGKAHLLLKLNGEQKNYFSGPPTEAEIAANL